MRLSAVPSLLMAVALGAQMPPTAATVTEPGRTLARPLDIVLGGPRGVATERTIVVVLDPAASLGKAGFANAFAEAVEANKETLTRTRIGLGVVGRPDCIVVPPTLDHAKVIAEIGKCLAQPAAEFQNVYAAVRTAVGSFYRSKGERIFLLVTLENGDVEDDVQKTVQVLQKAKVRLEVLTSEATLADSYWAARPHQRKPRGTTLTGSDAAVVDVPWGFVFQIGSANEATPAGFAMWGLTRLAAATGGRVFLHATANQIQHKCSVNGSCLFCRGDHQPADAGWNSALVAQLAPLSSSRKDTYSALGRDPSFRAMVETWRDAAKAGLMSSEPGIRFGATTASPDRARKGRNPRLVNTASFGRNAKRAEQAAKKAKALGDKLAAQIAKLPAEAASHRTIAAARYTVVLLQITRVNLLMFAAWCREDAQSLFDKNAQPLPPEVTSVNPERRPHGVGYTNLCLCHGVRPFFDVELPGGAALRPELERLDALFLAFQLRYGKSQFGYALRRNGLARFYPTFPGLGGKRPRHRPKSNNRPIVPITPRRPARQGGSSGAASGPVTGGGR